MSGSKLNQEKVETTSVVRLGPEAAKYVEHPLVKGLHTHLIGSHHYSRIAPIYREQGADSHIVLYCFGGKGWFQFTDGPKTVVRANTAITIPPKRPYAYGSDPREPWSIYYVHVRGDHVPHYFHEAPQGRIVKLDEKMVECKSLLAQCLEVLKMDISVTDMIYSANLLGQVLSICCLYQRQPPGSAIKSSAPIRELVQFMNDRLDQRLTLQQLCEQSNVSRPHLVRLFREHTGYSPIDYFLRLKIQRACEYFELSDLSVKEVSYRLGFADPYYFSRMFSKITGQSPTQYREHRDEHGNLL